MSDGRTLAARHAADVSPDAITTSSGAVAWLRRARKSGLLAQALQPSLVLAVLILLIVILWAVLPQVFTSGDPYTRDLANKLAAPSLEHPFGTDSLGRDLFTRFVHGTRTTLLAALIALAIGLGVSSVIGLLAGYLGGAVDEVVGRVIDVFLAVPGLLIALMLVTGLGFGIVNIAVAVGVSSIAMFTRVLRAEVLRVRQSDFVTAAVHSGLRWYTVVRKHVRGSRPQASRSSPDMTITPPPA
ncbi:ABC transporter permease [Nocardia salmonicida]|uniref:ABC transporter permease n=1 Tax=Nocardia salmonicida TaxID=53431 RepID=UPI003663D0A2